MMRSLTVSATWMAATLNSEGLISSVSPGTGHILGGSPVELIGKPVTTFLADRSAYEIPRILETARHSGIWEGEVTCKDSNGKDVNVRMTIASLLDAAGQVSGFSVLGALLEKLEPEAGQVEFSSQVGATLRSLSHELNNPLAGIMGFAQLIMLDKHCEGPLRSNMENLFEEVKSVIEVVEKLHSYAVSLQR